MPLPTNLKKEINQILPTFRKAVKKFIDSSVAKNLDCYKNEKLTCACAITSHALASLFEKKGLTPSVILGVYVESGQKIDSITPEDINHCWVELESHIIDLTSTQFEGGSEIIFRPIKRSGKKFIPIIKTSVKDMKQDVTDWPSGQIPSLRNTKHILRNYQTISGENLGV